MASRPSNASYFDGLTTDDDGLDDASSIGDTDMASLLLPSSADEDAPNYQDIERDNSKTPTGALQPATLADSIPRFRFDNAYKTFDVASKLVRHQ